ncbi:MAG: hypothetical protein NZ455_03875 [Bacteroidia bacterium]|nr:hypothetical protein [Bacteroidia bacterium]
MLCIYLMYACTSKEEQYKKTVKSYYDAYYQKRDINAVKALFSEKGIQYNDDNYKMSPDTFTLIFDFDKKIQTKAYIVDIKVNKDTVIVLEKLADQLDALLKRPSPQYRKRFIFKEGKIYEIISKVENEKEWTDKYLQATQNFLLWVFKKHPTEYQKISLEPYNHAELLLTNAKEYAKELK